jgi:hypothetical protein
LKTKCNTFSVRGATAKVYQHLTTQECGVIMTMRADLCCARSFAKRLCRSASTIGRELKRTSASGIYNAILPPEIEDRLIPGHRMGDLMDFTLDEFIELCI